MPEITDLEKAINSLRKALTMIERSYFNLPVAGEAGKPATMSYLERVYCYELYHQWRTILDRTEFQSSGYKLTGEVDKDDNPAFWETNAADKIPDFTLHTPGLRKNLLAVEVKAGRPTPKKTAADLFKLATYQSSKIGYQGCVFLVYGPMLNPSKVKSLIDKSKRWIRNDKNRELLEKKLKNELKERFIADSEWERNLIKTRFFLHSIVGETAVEYSLETGEVVSCL